MINTLDELRDIYDVNCFDDIVNKFAEYERKIADLEGFEELNMKKLLEITEKKFNLNTPNEILCYLETCEKTIVKKPLDLAMDKMSLNEKVIDADIKIDYLEKKLGGMENYIKTLEKEVKIENKNPAGIEAPEAIKYKAMKKEKDRLHNAEKVPEHLEQVEIYKSGGPMIPEGVKVVEFKPFIDEDREDVESKRCPHKTTVTSWAMNKSFLYCRDCKNEVIPSADETETPKASEIPPVTETEATKVFNDQKRNQFLSEEYINKLFDEHKSEIDQKLYEHIIFGNYTEGEKNEN